MLALDSIHTFVMVSHCFTHLQKTVMQKCTGKGRKEYDCLLVNMDCVAVACVMRRGMHSLHFFKPQG